MSFGEFIEKTFSGGSGDLLGTGIGIAHANYSAAKQRHFQRSMDNTRFQRAARDLEAAGLNRIIALGSPGSPGNSSAPTVPGPQFGATALRAAQTATAKQAVEQSKAITAATTAQEELYRSQARAADAQARLTNANASEAEFKKMIYEKVGPQLETLVDGFIKRYGLDAKGASDIQDNVVRYIQTVGDYTPAGILKNASEWLMKKVDDYSSSSAKDVKSSRPGRSASGRPVHRNNR